MAAKYDSGVLDFISGDATTDVITPLSGPMPSGDWGTVTVDLWLRALTAKVRIGVQFTNNPSEFTAAAKELAVTYVTAVGWTRGTTLFNLFAVTGATPATYFRFVAMALNTSGSLAGAGQIRIVVTPTPFNVFKRLASPYVRANTKASDSSYAYTPAVPVFETAGITGQRVMLDVAGVSGAIKVQAGSQETDTPDDASSWANVGTVGSEVTAVGVVFPTVFVAVTFTKRYGRYVVSAKNDTGGTEVESAMVRIVVEARG